MVGSMVLRWLKGGVRMQFQKYAKKNTHFTLFKSVRHERHLIPTFQRLEVSHEQLLGVVIMVYSLSTFFT